MDKQTERSKIAGMGGATMGNDLAKYQNEIKKIKQKATVQSDKITVKEIVDHKNISLWTKWGKRIGPLHRTNALHAFELFWTLGIQLSTDQPTPEQIKIFWESDEGKAMQKTHEEKRAIKEQSRKSGQMEKLAKEIAKMSGMTVEAINKILASGKPLSEGQKNLGAQQPGQNLDGGTGVGSAIKDGDLSNTKPKE